MAITKFVPEIWSAQILSILAKNLVFAGAPCVNRDYEGEISAYGDTVHIPTVADVSIVDYTKDTDLTIQTLTDDQLSLVINQSKAFAFEVDDIDMRQTRAGGAMMAEAASRAAFGLRDVADQYVRDLMAAGAGSGLGLIDGTTPSNVYDDLIVPAGVALDENNVPTEGRFLVLTPAAYGKLQLDDRFIKANESGTMALHNGVVGAANGFQILKSNNAKTASRTVTVTNTSGTKLLTGAAGDFSQADVGLAVTGTGVAASSTIASVNADGSVATLSANTSAAVTSATVAGADLAVAGLNIGTSYAEQINKVEAFRPQARFADALKGLHLYGAKVVRSEALVVASVKTA